MASENRPETINWHLRFKGFLICFVLFIVANDLQGLM